MSMGEPDEVVDAGSPGALANAANVLDLAETHCIVSWTERGPPDLDSPLCL